MNKFKNIFTVVALAMCFGGWLNERADAESLDQEAVIKVNPYNHDALIAPMLMCL